MSPWRSCSPGPRGGSCRSPPSPARVGPHFCSRPPHRQPRAFAVGVAVRLGASRMRPCAFGAAGVVLPGDAWQLLPSLCRCSWFWHARSSLRGATELDFSGGVQALADGSAERGSGGAGRVCVSATPEQISQQLWLS